MDFEIHKQNDNMLDAIRQVYTNDMPTDTRWLSEEELMQKHQQTLTESAVKSIDVTYGEVFNSLVKEIAESTDTQLKNTLETLCYVLMKEHTEEDIVSESVLFRLQKISTLQVIRESAVELISEATATSVILPTTKNMGSFGEDLAEVINQALDNEDIKFNFQVKDLSYDKAEPGFVITSTKPVSKNDLSDAIYQVVEYLDEENGISSKLLKKEKYK